MPTQASTQSAAQAMMAKLFGVFLVGTAGYLYRRFDTPQPQ